ncbi:MAG: hypothetical protein K8R73_01250 [Clostridiales bacterium]|nr:hypothetical protein [Clostridiales bacterium]
MKNRRVIRIAVIIVSILLAYLLYASEYSMKPEQSSLESGIHEFLDKSVTVIDFIEVDNTLFVYYTLGSNDSIGFTALHKGINSRYQIRSANYSTRNRVIDGAPFKTNGGEYLAVMGTNYDGKIARVRIKTYSGEIFSEDVLDRSEILTIFSTKEPTRIEEFQLYDKDNNDITEEMKAYLTTKENHSTGVGKAELFMLYVFCFVIILMGYAISRSIKD